MATQRTVSVRLIADTSQYVGALGRAGAATTGLTSSLTRGFGGAGMGALALGGAITAGLGMAISKSMEFEKAMSAVSAATGASAAALGDLRAAAMEAGADTQYSATEAADAITEMAKAGVSAGDIMGGGLTGALSLAAAGQMDVADAAGIAAVAMTQFKLSGEDLPHVADLLAAGAGKAMGSVDDLGAALNQAGLVASSAGLSIEETTGTLAAFASAGLIGSDAGTSLKTMLQRLQNPSEEAAGTMRDLGISMYDANGNFVGMESLAGQLHDGMSNLTPAVRDAAMATIFGSDAVRAANVLYSEGADGIAGWTDAVDDAGYAADQAAALNDNLSGDLERLGGSFDTLMINIGSGAQGPLRALVQGLTDVVDVVSTVITWFADLPGPVLLGVAAIGGLALANTLLLPAVTNSALALAGWYGRAVATAGGAGIASVAMGVLRGAMASTMTLMGGPLGLAVVGLTVGLGFLIPALSGSEDKTDDLAGAQQTLADAIRQTGGAIDDTVRSQAALSAEQAGLMDWADTWGVASGDIIDATLGNEDALRRVADAAASYEETQTGLSETTSVGTAAIGSNTAASQSHLQALLDLAGTTEDSINGERDRAEALNETAAAEAEAAAVAADWTNALHFIGDTTGWTEEQIESATESVTKWRDELAGISGAFVEPLDVYKSQIQQLAQATADSTEDSSDSWSDYEANTTASLDEVAHQLEEQVLAQQNWRTNIVIATQRGGLEVGQALAAMGQDGAGLVQQMVDATDEDFGRMRDLLITDARLGGQGAAAEMDSAMRVMAAVGAAGASATVFGIATQLGIGADAVRNIAAQYGVNLAEGVNPILTAVGLPRVTIQTNGINRNTTGTSAFAEGGYTGDGGKYEPAGVVHRGEFVVTKERTAKLGVNTLENLERILPGYAGGGFVTGADVPQPPGTGRAGVPLSTSGAGTMNKGYTSVKKWVDDLYALHQATQLAAGGYSGAASPNGANGLGPKAAAARLFAMQRWGVTNIGGFAARNIAGTGTLSDHATGHAIDIMMTPDYNSPGKRKLGSEIAEYFRTNPGQFGTKYVIYYDRIANGGAGWTPYKHPGGGSSDTLQHRDHVHVSVFDKGGVIEGGQLGANLSGKPERVLSPRQTEAFEQWMSGREVSGAAMSGPSGGSVRSVQYGDIHVTANPDRESIARVVKQVLHEREVLTSPWAS